MIRRLYNWTLQLAAHRHATLALAGISFIESSVFPIPPDVLLIPMCLADRMKSLRYATVCTVASVLGGILGYVIGYLLYDTLGVRILDFYGYHDQFATFQEKYNAWGIWIVLMAGLTPFPYKIITIASGVTQMNFVAFVLISLIARSCRFYLVAGLLWKFGAPLKNFIEKYLGLLTILFFILLIGGFAAIKYVL